jgi:hypothetical protein
MMLVRCCGYVAPGCWLEQWYESMRGVSGEFLRERTLCARWEVEARERAGLLLAVYFWAEHQEGLHDGYSPMYRTCSLPSLSWGAHKKGSRTLNRHVVCGGTEVHQK